MSVVVLPELIEMETPLGRGHAIVLETTAHDYFWTVVLGNGALVTFPQDKVRAARSFMYHCAWSVTQGHDIVREVSMLKALTGELVNEVLQTCQQFHGGMGYMRDTAIERLWRDARILAIGGGATEVMLDEVAKRY